MTLRFAIILCTAVGFSAVAVTASAQEADGDTAVEQVDVGVKDVLERLKLLRIQMALDREEIAAMQLRIEKLNLQRDFASLAGTSKSKVRGKKKSRTSAGAEILVKAIYLKPRKEAIIMMAGKMYTVRPGDRVGNFVITDINEGGLKVKNAGGDRSPETVR